MKTRYYTTIAYVPFLLCFLFTLLEAVDNDTKQIDYCMGYGCYPSERQWADSCSQAVPGNTKGWYIPRGGAFNSQPNGCIGTMCGPIEYPSGGGCTVQDNPDCPPPSKAKIS